MERPKLPRQVRRSVGLAEVTLLSVQVINQPKQTGKQTGLLSEILTMP